VLVAPNLFGNIATNIGASLVGGPGLISGYSLGPNHAIFEHSGRHEAADIAGKNRANPVSPLLCSSLMLEHLGLEGHGQRIRQAVDRVLMERRVMTPDLPGGRSGTLEMTQAIINALQEAPMSAAM
jgi:isocitrate dehydrogenase (NAD+)